MTAPSARGLFRATGKTSKPVAVRDLLTGEILRAAALERDPHDFRATPAEATRALIACEGERLRSFDMIWEPAAGDGAISDVFLDAGMLMNRSDLVDRGFHADICDFFAFSVAPCRAIVTNPPFQECAWATSKARWITHALDVLGVAYMALLLPWQWPGAAGLGPLWERRPPARVYLMRWRIDFTGQGASPMLNAWYVWDGPTTPADVRLLMLDRADARQSEMFGDAS